MDGTKSLAPQVYDAVQAHFRKAQINHIDLMRDLKRGEIARGVPAPVNFMEDHESDDGSLMIFIYADNSSLVLSSGQFDFYG